MDDIKNRQFYSDMKKFGQLSRHPTGNEKKPNPSYLETIKEIAENRTINKPKSFNVNINSPDIISQAISFNAAQNSKGNSKDSKYSKNKFGNPFKAINEGLFDDMVKGLKERTDKARIVAGMGVGEEVDESELQQDIASQESALQQEIKDSGGQPNENQRRRLRDLNARKDVLAGQQADKELQNSYPFLYPREKDAQKKSDTDSSETEPATPTQAYEIEGMKDDKSNLEGLRKASEEQGGLPPDLYKGGVTPKTEEPKPASPTTPSSTEVGSMKKEKSKEFLDLQRRTDDNIDAMARARAMPGGYGEGGGAEGNARRRAERQARNAAIANANIEAGRIKRESQRTPEAVAEREARDARIKDRKDREGLVDRSAPLAAKNLLNQRDASGRVKTPEELTAEAGAEKSKLQASIDKSKAEREAMMDAKVAELKKKNQSEQGSSRPTPSYTTSGSPTNRTTASPTGQTPSGGQSGKFGGNLSSSGQSIVDRANNVTTGGQSGVFGEPPVSRTSDGRAFSPKPGFVKDREAEDSEAKAAGSSIKTLSSGNRVGVQPKESSMSGSQVNDRLQNSIKKNKPNERTLA